MFAHLANDGKHGQQEDRCNCRLQMHGHLHTSRRILGLDTNKADWAASENLWDYGEGYWNDGIKVKMFLQLVLNGTQTLHLHLIQYSSICIGS